MALMGNEGLSIADAMALSNNNKGGIFGEGGGSLVFFLFFLLAWGNGGLGGFGGANSAAANGALTRAELDAGFTMNNVQRDLSGIQKGLCDGFYAQNSEMLNGFCGMQNNISNAANNIQQAVTSGFANTQLGLSDLGYNIGNSTCSINRNIDAVRYENIQNTSAIVNAIKEDGAATRALINSNTMQDLRDKLSDKERALQTSNFLLSQQDQNSTLINALKPCPIPAYMVCSPYASCNCCGCN